MSLMFVNLQTLVRKTVTHRPSVRAIKRSAVADSLIGSSPEPPRQVKFGLLLAAAAIVPGIAAGAVVSKRFAAFLGEEDLYDEGGDEFYASEHVI